ncbi:LysE family translocator [Paenibacillus cisolokensis]|uniref:LysE family translocator n=1 Tax=Paenibacillus cisolokensis TaxID=1658519 RepID=A0ABQ4N2T7_9BACL|nr:LysE family translocator [Paenibacillus cisolokensis]GIQ62480.1 LysE family translocator [Paenibacillus cisolokensis]
MLPLEQIIAFLAVAVALTLMPGPDILFVAAQSVSRSARSGIAVALGLCTGLIVHTSLAAGGISAVVLSSPVAFRLVKALGALYLLYLAWKAVSGIRRNDGGETAASPATPQPAAGAAEAAGERLPALYRRGILMSTLNPKVSLFFLALLPQFVTPAAGSVPLQMIQLGALFMAQALAVFTVVALLAGRIGRSLMNRSPKWTARFAVAEAVIYAGLAVNLLLTGN